MSNFKIKFNKMDFHISGNYEHYGDNIEKGGKKIVYNGYKTDSAPLTKEELKRKVDIVRPKIKSDRMWFSVCKYMMWRHMCAEADFKDACSILSELYPELTLNSDKMASLNMGTLKGGLDDWEFVRNKPFAEEVTFGQYKLVAILLYEA